ncbi:ketopantoate reductase family protein [Bombiscardovia coagulans]|nr:ketopantoate reductase family protein [Bombiscardovia coagulans]
MRYAMIGAGAMGYRYGVLLQELAGVPVDYIDTWQPNIDAVRQQGGVYVSRDHADRHLVPINMYTPEEYEGNPDVWMVFMKQMQLETMLQRCAHLFKDHQVVFSAMNGWGHFEKINQYFPENRIYGGTALVATVLNGPGDVDFMGKAGAGTMEMCAMNEEITAVEEALAADFQTAGFNPTITQNFHGTCLAKIIFNAVANTICTMYQIRMGQFISFPGALSMAEQLINEAYDACERAGYQMTRSRQEELKAIEISSRVTNPLHYPSMYQDLTAGRPTEVDYINGYIAHLGRQHDYICRTHEFLVQGVHLAELAFRIHTQEAQMR